MTEEGKREVLLYIDRFIFLGSLYNTVCTPEKRKQTKESVKILPRRGVPEMISMLGLYSTSLQRTIDRYIHALLEHEALVYFSQRAYHMIESM